VKFLLDTCSVSDYLRGVESVVQRLQRSKPSEVAISAVTVMELRYGAARRQSTKLTAAVEAFLNGVSILAFDAESAERAGVMRATMDGNLKRVPELKVVDWRQ